MRKGWQSYNLTWLMDCFSVTESVREKESCWNFFFNLKVGGKNLSFTSPPRPSCKGTQPYTAAWYSVGVHYTVRTHYQTCCWKWSLSHCVRGEVFFYMYAIICTLLAVGWQTWQHVHMCVCVCVCVCVCILSGTPPGSNQSSTLSVTLHSQTLFIELRV